MLERETEYQPSRTVELLTVASRHWRVIVTLGEPVENLNVRIHTLLVILTSCMRTTSGSPRGPHVGSALVAEREKL